MSPFVITILTAIGSSAIWPALLPKIIEWKNRRQEEERERREAERETWFRESASAYRRVKRECASCAKRLEQMDERWYTLLDSLEEVVSASEGGFLTVSEVRAVVRKARQHEQQQRAMSAARLRQEQIDDDEDDGG